MQWEAPEHGRGSLAGPKRCNGPLDVHGSSFNARGGKFSAGRILSETRVDEKRIREAARKQQAKIRTTLQQVPPADGRECDNRSLQNQGCSLLQKPAGGACGEVAGGSRTEAISRAITVTTAGKFGSKKPPTVIENSVAPKTESCCRRRSHNGEPTIEILSDALARLNSNTSTDSV